MLPGAARIKDHSIDVCIERPAAIASNLMHGSLRALLRPSDARAHDAPIGSGDAR